MEILQTNKEHTMFNPSLPWHINFIPKNLVSANFVLVKQDTCAGYSRSLGSGQTLANNNRVYRING